VQISLLNRRVKRIEEIPLWRQLSRVFRRSREIRCYISAGAERARGSFVTQTWLKYLSIVVIEERTVTFTFSRSISDKLNSR
jgi:hypothetical protein